MGQHHLQGEGAFPNFRFFGGVGWFARATVGLREEKRPTGGCREAHEEDPTPAGRRGTGTPV